MYFHQCGCRKLSRIQYFLLMDIEESNEYKQTYQCFVIFIFQSTSLQNRWFIKTDYYKYYYFRICKYVFCRKVSEALHCTLKVCLYYYPSVRDAVVVAEIMWFAYNLTENNSSWVDFSHFSEKTHLLALELIFISWSWRVYINI